jgi:hypothetical protein
MYGFLLRHLILLVRGSLAQAQTMTVNDVVPSSCSPECSNAYPSKTLLWPPDHKFQAVTIQGVTNPSGNEVTILIDDIVSDEDPATAKGAGGATKTQDAYGVGTNTANLRAQRSGVGDGRVYQIKFTASDVFGGKCQGSVTVSVPHDQSERFHQHKVSNKPTTCQLPTTKPSLRKYPTNKPAKDSTKGKPTVSTSKPTTLAPVSNHCFTSAELKSAVDDYINEDCSVISTCPTRLKYGAIGTWCTSKVTDMSYLFDSKGSFNDDISLWDLRSVTDVSYMFYNASSFNSLRPVDA